MTTSSPGGTVHRAGPASYRDRLGTLQPGDVLELEPGVYADGLPLHDLHGTPPAPITITGPANGARPVFMAARGRHTVSLMDSSHIVLRRLELDGRHEPVDGVKAEGQGQRRCVAVHDIVLDDLHIHDHDHDQQSVGINAKCVAWRWIVRRTIVERAGTGMYFGGSSGDTPFLRSVIEENLVRDTLGYSLQIKHQTGWPDLPGLPAGSGVTTIRHNVFDKTQRGATGSSARPNVLLGHWPLDGPGAGDVYEIYGNVFDDNPSGEPLLQAEGRLAIYNNLFLDRHGDAVWIRPHHDRPRRVHFFWNTVVATGDGVRVAGADAGASVLVAGNAVFAGRTPIRGVAHQDDVTDRYDRAGAYLTRPYTEPVDLGPLPARLIGPALDLSALSAFSGWNDDVEGRRRDGTYRGAYHGPGARPWPVWAPVANRRSRAAASPKSTV